MANTKEVKNVYLFIADSVRHDTTGDEIMSLGVSGRAIAPSTWTASSFPSIMTGQYPSTHCIWSFDNCLSDYPALLSGPETFGMHAETIWKHLSPAEKPPFQMIGATDDEAIPLANLEPPFISVEHHKGGHLPYGYSFDQYTVPEFWDNVRPQLADLKPLYQESVQTAEERFLTALEGLRERDLLEETLVIYTSDHGEIFGEPEDGAKIGHGDPMSPDLVNVPIVFAGAGLPDVKSNILFSGTDILPTILSALGRNSTWQTDGNDHWKTKSNDRLVRSECWIQHTMRAVGDVNRYKAASVWDSNGGYVFHKGNRFVRLALALRYSLTRPWGYSNPNTPRDLNRWTGLFKIYGSDELKYGSPQFSKKEGIKLTEEFQESFDQGITPPNREQLRQLGYIE